MDKAVQDEIDKLTRIMVNTVPVEKIYLFGSYAYGTPHKEAGHEHTGRLAFPRKRRSCGGGISLAGRKNRLSYYAWRLVWKQN
jgi:hypothetical protein